MAMPLTQSGERSRAYARAELAYLRATDERHAPVQALLAEDPGSIPAWLLAIGKRVAAKDANVLPGLAAALQSAAPLERAATDAERAHFAAARAWLAHEPLRAAHVYSRIARSSPRDLLALRLAQSCWYFLGHRTRVRVVAERALRDWPPAAPGYDVVLAMAAFGRAETGDGRGAAALAERALALEPRSPFARHALAHGLAAQGRVVTAHHMLEDSAALWRVGGRMDTHNAWHQALYGLDLGRSRAALAAFDREFAAASDTGDCADATDLLWRLDLAGVDTGVRWQPLAAAWARSLTPGFWGFLDVLAGIAFQRAGRSSDAHALRRALASSRTQASMSATAAASRTALAAIDAFTQGDHAHACGLLQSALPRLGGSLAQRELLELTLAAAQRRADGECLVAEAA